MSLPIASVVPKKGSSISEYTTKVKASGQDVSAAIIDGNGDGKYNYGTKEGDTAKIFDWKNGRATGHHLVQPGEPGMYGSTPAGKVNTTEVPLGRSLKKTYDGLTREQIAKVSPGATLEGGDKFEPGATITFKSADGTEHKAHYVKAGELPAETAKKTGVGNIADVKSDKGVQAGCVVWGSITGKK